MIILTDLFDPAKGSEFQVPSKFIKEFLDESPNKKISIYTFDREDNSRNIHNWIKLNNFQNRIEVNLFKFKFSSDGVNHRFSFLFYFDLLALYKYCLKNSDTSQSIYKIGQVSFLFNLHALFSKRVKLIGPISGFELSPIIAIFKLGYFALAIKYLSIFLLSKTFIFFVWLRIKYYKEDFHLIFATEADKMRFNTSLFDCSNFYTYLISEINIKELLILNQGHTNESEEIDILWSGHLVKRKNPFFAFKILSLIIKNNPSLNILMIGSGPLEEKLSAYLHNSNINFLSDLNRTEFLKVVRNSKCVFISSFREVNSVFIFECLANNKKIIVPNLSGMKNVFKNYPNNVYDMSSNNVNEISNQIFEILKDEDEFPGIEILNKISISEESNFKSLIKNV